MARKFWSFVAVLLFVLRTSAQQDSAQFNISVKYLVYLPEEYRNDTSKQWPLMLFLHGSGESGDDLSKVKVHGPPKLIERGKKFPFIVVSPQAPLREGWEPQVMVRLVKDLQTRYRVDKERIYLTGLSMGGFGTWAIAKKFPSLFAAIAPVCGGGDTSEMWRLRNVAVWCFHGAKDDVVKPEESYRMVNALKKYNNRVKFTVYPEANHDSWTPTYNNDSLYTWLLQHKRYRFPRTTLTEKELINYTGAYMADGADTLHLVMKNGKLVLKNEPSIEVIPTNNNNFFLSVGDDELEVRFHKNRRGRVNGFVVYQEDELTDFRRVD